MKTKYNGKKITLTKGYINAVKNLMREEILMMRKVNKKYAELWYCGSASVSDLASAEGLSFCFGSKEDVQLIKKTGEIFIIEPFYL